MSLVQGLWLMMGVQATLFGLGWLGAGQFAHEMRRPMRHVAQFNLLLGPGVVLVGLREVPLVPYLLSHGVANVLHVAAVTALLRAGDVLYFDAPTQRKLRRLYRLLLWLVAPGLLWLGSSEATAQARAGLAQFALALACGIGVWAAWRRLRNGSEHPHADRILLLLALGLVLLLGWNASSRLLQGLDIELRRTTPATMVAALFVVQFGMNMVFVNTLFGRLVRQLRSLSRHDWLTGLPNRRALMECLHAEWTRFARAGKPLAVLCLDVDHFKAINDSAGHAAGDAALVGLAQVLRDHIRQGDVVGRNGGEEFVVVLPETDTQAAVEVAERLRRAVAQAERLHPLRTQALTVSIGAACATASDPHFDALLARADAALYRAKNGGRNRVVAGTTDPRGEIDAAHG